MTYQQLLAGVLYTGRVPEGEAVLVTQDSRKVAEGTVFVAIRGRGSDGHSYAQQALDAGAGMVVTQRRLGLPKEVVVGDSRAAYAAMCQTFFGHPAQKLALVGVTGTNGKTTVASLVKQILQKNGVRCGLIGTIHSEIGEMLIPAKYTTPDAWDLNALFARMVAAGCTHAVMEASSQALDQGRLLGLSFALAIFTNLSADHLDWHGDMQAYYAAKAKLFGSAKQMLVNIDDAWGRRLLAEETSAEAFTYSTGKDSADFVAKGAELTASGVRFALLWGDELLPVRFAMPGGYSVANALCAAAAAILLGTPAAEAAGALTASKGVPGRCEVLHAGAFTVIRDFAHTGDAMDKLLGALRPHVAKRLVVLFGCAGMRDAQKRPAMGQAAAEYADEIFLSADNPRGEDVHKTMEDALGPIKQSGKPYHLQPDRAAAVCQALDTLSEGDMLVLCGKGHEDYQVLQNETIFLSEKQLVEDWLQGTPPPAAMAD